MRFFIPGFIGLNTLIYGAWLYVGLNPSDQPRYGRGRGGGRGRRPKRRLLTSWLTPEFMRDHFLLGTRNLREGRWWTLLTYAVSHRGLAQLAGSMAAFHTFAAVAAQLCDPVSVALVLCLGSAAAGALAQLYDWHHRRRDGVVLRAGSSLYVVTVREGCGASAITAGLAMAVTVLQPWKMVNSPLLPFPLPLWVSTLGWFLYDWCELGSVLEAGTFVGHAGHLGGMAFGAVYAGLRLARRPAHPRDIALTDIIDILGAL